MHTEDEEREILYPNINYCRFLKNWVKYTVAQGKDALEGFYTRQKQIGEVLNLNYEDLKPAVSVHLRDIVVTMLVSNLLKILGKKSILAHTKWGSASMLMKTWNGKAYKSSRGISILAQKGQMDLWLPLFAIFLLSFLFYNFPFFFVKSCLFICYFLRLNNSGTGLHPWLY